MKKSGRFVGIDPGQSGGIAVLDQYKVVLTVMPATETDVWRWIRDNCVGCTSAVIEKVHAMPQQGVSSTFKFGVGVGLLRGCLIAAGISWEEVTPQRWIKALEIPYRGKTETKVEFKNRLKAKAQRLFPGIDVTLKTADALLLATYCQKKYEGKL